MKKLLTLVLVFTVTAVSFAQKDEIKALEKALKKSNFADAKSAASVAEGLKGNMDDKTKAKFLFLQAQALYANGAASDSDLDKTIKTLEELKNHESSIGKLRYTEDANEMKTKIYNSFLTKANSAFESGKLAEASVAYENIYKISPKDTSFLYNAALLSAQNNDYDTSLKHFIKLKELGYTGIKMTYRATNKETGNEEPFVDKGARDFSVKTLKPHIKPVDVLEESKRAYIVKNIASIYVSQGKNEQALAITKDARSEFPDDKELLLTEAVVLTKVGNNEQALVLFKKALEEDPNNANLNFNVGVTAMEANQYDVAKSAFEQALKLKPDYLNAAMNLSFIEVDKGNSLYDEMNKLGDSSADYKRYDELKAQKDQLFKAGAEILENFVTNNPDVAEAGIFNQLANIYSALGETDKYNKYKEKAKKIEEGN